MYGNRVFLASGPSAESDKLYAEFVYFDTSGSLKAGMPVNTNLIDAGDQNTGGYAGSAAAVTPAQVNNGGQVLLCANASAGRLVGIFQPDSPSTKPNKGDAIKCIDRGMGVGFVDNVGGAVLVGSNLICVPTTSNNLRLGAAAIKVNAGEALPTGAVVALLAPITTGAGLLVNMRIFVQ